MLKSLYLVEDVLVAGMPCVTFGPAKSLTTSLSLDLAISLATQTDFLGHFKVARPCNVLFMSGDGLAVLRDKVRAICEARGVNLADVDRLTFSPSLPKFKDEEHLRGLSRALNITGSGVLFIDPADRCMDGTDANLLSQGEKLCRLQNICAEHDALPNLVRHTVKLRGRDAFRPLTLSDLSGGCCAEWTRQWIALNRTGPYEAGSGKHQLYLSIGASTGHSGEYVLAIDEGTQDEPKWEVKVQAKEIFPDSGWVHTGVVDGGAA